MNQALYPHMHNKRKMKKNKNKKNKKIERKKKEYKINKQELVGT
jgi:hypothetical protein